MIVEVQCLPNPPGTPEEPYRHVEAAIAQIEGSGLTYEVDALGTTIEGEPERVWPLLRRVHEACLTSGAASLVTVIKVEQSVESAGAPTIRGLTAKFRR